MQTLPVQFVFEANALVAVQCGEAAGTCFCVSMTHKLATWIDQFGRTLKLSGV